MALILLGLNHKTTPLDLRERLSFSSGQLSAALSDLYTNYLLASEETPGKKLSSEPLCEALILSTCNRLEIYAVVQDLHKGWDTIEQFLMQQGSFRWGSLDTYLYRLAGHDVVEHLMRVASGLDSMILGEPQIIGQVAEAFNAAQQARTTGTVLSHLLAEVLHTGKRVYTETPISRHTTSTSHAAVQLIQTNLASARVLILGAGEVAIQAARALRMHHVESITCINRTQTRAVDLAEQIQGKALPWKALPQALVRADVLIATTSAPGILLNRQAIQAALTLREGRGMTIIDLAVPRNIEPAVAELPGVHLYNIDSLQATLDKNLALRQAAIPQVEAILKEGVESFLSWLHSRQVIPVLTSFRSKISTLADAEIKLALNRMEGLNQQSQQAVVRAIHRVVNKMLHEPTERLKAHAASGDGLIYVRALQDLFALDASLTSIERVDCPCTNMH